MDRQQHFTREDQRDRGRKVLGFFLAFVGVVVLLQMFHLLPSIVYSVRLGWPIVLIGIGLAIGVKNRFRKNAWWILMLIGVVHFIPPFYIGDVPARRILWPALLIIGGLAVVFRRHPRQGRSGREVCNVQPLMNNTDEVNIEVTFGGRKEIVTSKNFRGGRISASFSGAEINLTNADNALQPMVLDIRAAFAGIELIVPAHWEIQNEIAPTMGSIEDHRTIRMQEAGTEKRVLILRGSCTFGSVEIKSY